MCKNIHINKKYNAEELKNSSIKSQKTNQKTRWQNFNSDEGIKNNLISKEQKCY